MNNTSRKIRRITVRAFFVGMAVTIAGMGILILAMFLTHSAMPGPGGEHHKRIAFSNVNIVDPANDIIVRNQTLLIENGQIVAIQPSDQHSIPDSYYEEDMQGAYVSSGFWNMHAHFGRTSEHFSGPVQIMLGVMYARDLSGDCVGSSCGFNRSIAENKVLDREIAEGKLLGPTVFERGSMIIEGPRKAGSLLDVDSYQVPEDYESGRALAYYYADRGVDFLKPYNSLPPEALRGLFDGAKDVGIYVGGHVSKSFTLQEAVKMGLRTVEHGRVVPLACSEQSTRYAAGYRDWVEYRVDTAPNLSHSYRDIIETQRHAQCQVFLKTWAKADSYYVPTYLTRLTEAIVHRGEYWDDPRTDYIPKVFLDLAWKAEETKYAARFAEAPALEADFMDYFLASVSMTKLVHDAGVKLLVGTDMGDTLIYPGFSFHDEMALYVQGGLSPAETLVAATATAAKFTGVYESHGSVNVGKAANLVFLTRNPLNDISNTQSISSVYYQQHYYNKEARKEVLAAASGKTRGLKHHLILGWVIVSKILPLVPK
ncbi:MAG: amidohydrolase family protein, partial [Pseudomonadota bacterium]